VIGDNHKDETLYRWGNTLTYVWKGFGDKYTHAVYKGTVKNGKPNVQGTETLSDGKKYEGEWKDGKRNGQGTFTYPYGSKYVGEWKDGKYNGQGKETSLDGSNYVGEWKDGKYDGQGTFTNPDGGKYVGEWKDGESWNGTQTDKDGNIIGKWGNGVKQK